MHSWVNPDRCDHVLMLVYDWTTTLSFIFGGCCRSVSISPFLKKISAHSPQFSNAISLEQLISEYPHTGSLITFSQFFIISLHGLPKHVSWTRRGPRLKPRRIPIIPYLIQVALFYFISLLNNAAFAYHIPMTVHIIFRSGGLIISMLLGWVLIGKRWVVVRFSSFLIITDTDIRLFRFLPSSSLRSGSPSQLFLPRAALKAPPRSWTPMPQKQTLTRMRWELSFSPSRSFSLAF